MQSSIPLWVTIGLALSTGMFALAGQAVSGLFALRTQERIADNKEASDRRRERAQKREELYSLMLSLFDYTHEAVTRFRNYKKGFSDRQRVLDAINASADNDEYKRAMILLHLYFSSIQVIVSEWTAAASSVQELLMKWRDDDDSDIATELENRFSLAKVKFLEMKDSLAGSDQ